MGVLFSLFSWLLAAPLRPYAPPELDPEPQLSPTSTPFVEVAPPDDHWDVSVFVRPAFNSPLAGSVAKGEHVPVRGQVLVPKTWGCDSDVFYALEPFGYLCADHAKPSQGPASTAQVLPQRPDSVVPYRYVMLALEEGEASPMWRSVSDLWQYAEPERMLERGDTVAVTDESVRFEDERYLVAVDGRVLPARGTFTLKRISEWHGATLSADTHFPFGWVRPRTARVFDAPGGKKVGALSHRERVDVLGEELVGRTRWLRVGEAQYIRERDLNEVRLTSRPEGTGTHPQWIDVDLGEQVLVAYREGQPAFATLTSSGRGPNHSPRGNYPVWGKVATITMKSQSYDDHPYYVDRVPWVLFFQAHNALHGAYWHDRFGNVKSHGCVNLAPRDARQVFEWLEPKLPPGWTSVRYWNLMDAPVVHVRNSQRRKSFVQERNVGPPDPRDEAERLEQALKRREQEALEAAAAAAEAEALTREANGSGAASSFPMLPANSTPLYR